jgi:hypothetical protein
MATKKNIIPSAIPGIYITAKKNNSMAGKNIIPWQQKKL